MTTTTKNLQRALERLTRAMQAAEIPTDRIHLQAGSKTYGRAYRLYNRDPETGGLSTVPGMSTGGYLGITKADAVQSLDMLAAGIWMVVSADIKAVQ